MSILPVFTNASDACLKLFNHC